MKTTPPVKTKPSKKLIAAMQEVARVTANCKNIGEEMDAVGHDPVLFLTWAYFSPRRLKEIAERQSRDPKELETLKWVLDLCPEILEDAKSKNAIPKAWTNLSRADYLKVPKARVWLKRYRAQLAAEKKKKGT